MVVRDDNHPFAGVAHSLHAALHEDLDTCPVVARTPRRVRVEAVVCARIRKGIEAVVQRSPQRLQPLFVSETGDRSTYPFVEIEYGDLGRSVAQDPAVLEISHTDTDGIPVTNERELLPVRPLRDELALQEHIARLHVDLIKLAQGARPI